MVVFSSNSISLWAVPNSFLGNGNLLFPVIPAHPRFKGNLTRDVLAIGNWEKNAFPGPWEEVPALTGTAVKRMTAMPVLFGAVPDSVQAFAEEGRLVELAITYLDAGSFFGFKFGGERTHEEREAGSERRSEFDHHYNLLARDLRSRLEEGCGAGRQTVVGRSDLLRAVFTDYRWGGFVIRLATREGHSVTLHLMREEDLARSFFDEEIAALRPAERNDLFASRVRRNERGDVFVDAIPVFSQGNTPFCGIHSLAMVTDYYGLRLRADGLAASAQFRNTGSARGSDVLDLYHAAAEELDMRIKISSRFDFDRARKSIEAGMPVIVWRRVSKEREESHTRFAAKLAQSPGARLAAPTAAQRVTWPPREKKGSPSHASVVSGINEARGEVIFSEPWGEAARGRRMRFEEMEGTAYAVFFFQFQ